MGVRWGGPWGCVPGESHEDSRDDGLEPQLELRLRCKGGAPLGVDMNTATSKQHQRRVKYSGLQRMSRVSVVRRKPPMASIPERFRSVSV